MSFVKLHKDIILARVERERARYAEYDEYCESHYRRGYRPEHCPHGVNLWVDYDPICGYCENGYSYFDYQRAVRDAIDAVRAGVKRTRDITRAAEVLAKAARDAPSGAVQLGDEEAIWRAFAAYMRRDDTIVPRY